MGNFGNTTGLTIVRIDKGDVNEKSLIDIFDNDFQENEEQFREDTLSLGFNNEAERVSKEIFDNHAIDIDNDELDGITQMMGEVFEVPNFIGTSGHYDYAITETEYEYIISIAYRY